MSTSGSTDWELNRDEVITEALSILEVGVQGEDLDPSDIKSAVPAFNAMIKAFQARGMGLWLRDNLSITLVVDQHTYTLGPTGDVTTVRPLRILRCDRKNISTNNETSMTQLSLDEYNELPNKHQEGTPVDFFYEPTLSNGTLYLWPQPTSTDVITYTVELVVRTEVEDMDLPTDDLDFPSWFTEAIILNLAYRLAPRHGYPINERYLLRKDADDALEDALAYDQDTTSVFIQPDTRNYRKL